MNQELSAQIQHGLLSLFQWTVESLSVSSLAAADGCETYISGYENDISLDPGDIGGMRTHSLNAKRPSRLSLKQKRNIAFLRGLIRKERASIRALAKLSQDLARTLKQPSWAFTHQALSNWLAGSRNPTREHRRMLAAIFEIPVKEFDDRFVESLELEADRRKIVQRALLSMRRNDRTFRYQLTLRSDIDLGSPAVFRQWSAMFLPWPGSLVRHFGKTKFTLFGWIPFTSSPAIAEYAASLVPLQRSLNLDDREKHIWFVALPNGRTDVGIALRAGRSVMFSGICGSTGKTVIYPASRVDVHGYVCGPALFRLEAAVEARAGGNT